MAPAVVSSVSRRSASIETETKSDDTPQNKVPAASDGLALAIPEPIKEMMAEIKARIEKTHDYVGDTFAREVRAMHDGETEERQIYGEATPSEVRALIEDEIPVVPLPPLVSPKRVKGIQ